MYRRAGERMPSKERIWKVYYRGVFLDRILPVFCVLLDVLRLKDLIFSQVKLSMARIRTVMHERKVLYQNNLTEWKKNAINSAENGAQ